MKERPIIFNSESIRAILEGAKTQTRWVIKPQPDEWVTEAGYTFFTPNGHISFRGKTIQGHDFGEYSIPLKYCKGDRLWVREKWLKYDDETFLYAVGDGLEENDWRWGSPMFMPRKASRITLEVVNIRVERLRDISQADAKAEGAAPWFCAGDGKKETESGIELSIEHCPEEKRDYRYGYQILWDAINAKRGYGWDVNPWVWKIEFRRV